jgi:uncharacterized protein YkwD
MGEQLARQIHARRCQVDFNHNNDVGNESGERTMANAVTQGRSIKQVSFFCCMLLFFVSVPLHAAAQSSEEHDVEVVSAQDVGPFRPQNDPDLENVALSVVKQTNEFRESEGQEPVSTNEQLRQTAQDFADDMAETNRYGHTADGRRPSQRVSVHDYTYCVVAENIAYHFHTRGIATQPLADQAFTGWKNSPEHRRNMLKPHVTETGVALSQSESTGVYYAVQLFGRPRSSSQSFTLKNQTPDDITYRVGERSFLLPPHYSRTHQMCRPPTVKLVQGEQVIAEREPSEGTTLEVVNSDGRLKLQAVE